MLYLYKVSESMHLVETFQTRAKEVVDIVFPELKNLDILRIKLLESRLVEIKYKETSVTFPFEWLNLDHSELMSASVRWFDSQKQPQASETPQDIVKDMMQWAEGGNDSISIVLRRYGSRLEKALSNKTENSPVNSFSTSATLSELEPYWPSAI